jgi:type VI secretion system protein ImpB
MAKKSTQHKIGNVRPPRVQITYDVEVGDATQEKELPFVVGVLADLAPNSSQMSRRLRDREFTKVDAGSFDSVMASLRPSLKLQVANKLTPDAGSLRLDIAFDRLAAFSPDALVSSIPELSSLLEVRARLNDLLAKLEGNDRLNDLLAEVVANSELQERAEAEVRARSKSDDSPGE